MKYNKWKEANDYWRMVINKPFKIKGRNVMLLNYIATYSSRQNKSSYVTKTMYRFIDYLNNIGREIYSYATELNSSMYNLLYEGKYIKDLIGINPYISITCAQIKAVTNFVDAYIHYDNTYYNRSKLRKPIVNSLLDAIDEISPIQDVLRQHRYNRTHKRKHPYSIVNDNFFEHYNNYRTSYYDNYKQYYLECLKRKIDITKTLYKCNRALDTHRVFYKRRPKRK